MVHDDGFSPKFGADRSPAGSAVRGSEHACELGVVSEAGEAGDAGVGV